MASTTTQEQQSQRQVPITLHTSQATLSIPSIPYLVPTTWRRSQLSTLVNRLLQQDAAAETSTSKSIPFDFIINGELLRTSLSHYLASKGLTEESTVEIEYVRSTLPPTFTAAFEHDDWVSGVDASRESYFLTSSYDGSLRLFGQSTIDSALHTLQLGPTASLTDVCWIPQSTRVASSSTDGRLRISNMPITEDQSSKPHQISTSTVHASTSNVPMALSSVNADVSGSRLITAGWDGCVAIWSAAEGREEQREQEPSKKRRKAASGTLEGPADATASMSPLSIFWHTAPVNTFDKTPATNSRVAGAIWGHQADSAFSAGWDGNVRQWDVGAEIASSTKTSDKVILCLDSVVGASDTIITGHMDRSAALWDMRTSTTNISLSFQSAHLGPVGAIRRHPLSSHLFVTGSHDGQVKLWDTRSNHAALFSLVRPSKSKVLTVDWDVSGQTVVAGGEDCKLSVHRGHGIGSGDVKS
ncbi:hypothetical protein CBS101457_004070 [Exobasidium rhododendri]|nr:hypothetical protein CBS101457_004070 [Exobasidium rhododendri]